MTPRTFKTRDGLLSFLRTRPREVLHVLVEHDPGSCTPSRCVCRPSFRVEDCTAETFAAGERAQQEWLRAGLS